MFYIIFDYEQPVRCSKALWIYSVGDVEPIIECVFWKDREERERPPAVNCKRKDDDPGQWGIDTLLRQRN